MAQAAGIHIDWEFGVQQEGLNVLEQNLTMKLFCSQFGSLLYNFGLLKPVLLRVYYAIYAVRNPFVEAWLPF